MKKNIISLIGFSLFFIGIISLVLSLVGIRLQIISFADEISPLFGFVFKLILLFGGMIIFFMSRTNSYDPELDED